MYRLTLKVGRGRGLVGDGVEDLVDLGVEIWLFETPLTTWEGKKNIESDYARTGERLIV